MYKYFALGIIAIAGILAIPMSGESQDDSKMYGFVTLALKDSAGQAVFQQIIHNDIVDTGENYMLAQSFSNGTGGFIGTEADLIDALCVTVEVGFTVDEAENAGQFNTNDNTAGNNCETVAFTITNDQATTGATTFNATASTGNIVSGETITGIGVCSDKGSTGENVLDAFSEGCATATNAPGLLAEVNTSDVTLSGTETVDITYTLTLS